MESLCPDGSVNCSPDSGPVCEARDGKAENWERSGLYALGDRYGMVIPSFEARKRLRYIKPAAEKLECPDGKLRNPSSITDLSVF